jgi:hypothetical protein
VSTPTRFEASEEKATKRPSAEIEGSWLPEFPLDAGGAHLTRLVFAVPAQPGTAISAKASRSMRTSASTQVPRIRARAAVVFIRGPPRHVGGSGVGPRGSAQVLDPTNRSEASGCPMSL